MGKRRSNPLAPSGVLLVDKPEGITSAAVVARIRRLYDGAKAGHVGTLDPFASGLLPVCLGEATKLAGWLADGDKSYRGVVRLGVRTDTDDRTGEVLASAPPAIPSAEDLERLAAELAAETEQVPPAFSAIKRSGRPMYELARRGEAPELEARPCRVLRLSLARVDGERLAVEVDCGKGFYVRALARDIGERLGCGAHLESLVRTAVGRFRLADATGLAELESRGPAGRPAPIPLVEAVSDLRRVEVSEAEAAAVRQGRQEALLRLGSGREGDRAAVARGSDLVAIAACRAGLWTVERVLARENRNAPCPPSAIVLHARLSQTEEEERNEANRRDS